MPLTMDMSQDYLLWDLAEAITLKKNQGNGSYSPLAVATAVRAQPSQKERYPTQGKYTGTDLTWLLPGPLLAGYAPSPADIVKDSGGILWTLLSRDYDQLDQVYACYTVDLALANQLADSVDVQRATITTDTAGGVVRHWPDNNAAGVTTGGSTPYASLQAAVQPLTQAEAEERGIRGFRQAFAVVVALQVILTSEDRVKVKTGQFAGQYLQVTGTHNPSRIDELPVLDAVLVP